MRTFNHRNLTNKSFALYAQAPASVAKNGSDELVFTMSNVTDASASPPTKSSDLLKAGYTDEIANKPGLATYSVLINKCTQLNHLAENQNNSFVGTWSGDDLTLKGLKFSGDVSSITNITSVQIYKNRNFYMGGAGAPFDGYNSNSDFITSKN